MAIGFGMVPRGEVGLFFASLGAGLLLKGADEKSIRIVDSDTFSAIVFLSIVDTVITPTPLKWAMGDDTHKTRADATDGRF